jgi:phosphoribosylanthranilate isomerase
LTWIKPGLLLDLATFPRVLPRECRAVRRTRIKICCIASRDEARLAIEHGVDALGLVGAMPSGPGVIGDDRIAEIARSIGPPVAAFLLTSETDAAGIVEHARRCRAQVLQLVDRIGSQVHGAVRAALPGVKLVQVVHVTGPESIAEAVGLAPLVDTRCCSIRADPMRPSSAWVALVPPRTGRSAGRSSRQSSRPCS